MVQKASRSNTSPPNSPSPWGDWPEMGEDSLHLPTAISWQLARGGIAGESEEAVRRTLSARGPENPEEKEIALSLRMWVPLAHEPAAEHN